MSQSQSSSLKFRKPGKNGGACILITWMCGSSSFSGIFLLCSLWSCSLPNSSLRKFMTLLWIFSPNSCNFSFRSLGGPKCGISGCWSTSSAPQSPCSETFFSSWFSFYIRSSSTTLTSLIVLVMSLTSLCNLFSFCSNLSNLWCISLSSRYIAPFCALKYIRVMINSRAMSTRGFYKKSQTLSIISCHVKGFSIWALILFLYPSIALIAF